MLLHQTNKSRFIALVASCGALLLSYSARAQSVPILNGSFEYPTVPDGTYSSGVPGWGWTGADGNSAINVIVNPGGPSSNEPWPSTSPAGMDGNNFCQLFAYADYGQGELYQDTGIQFQAGKTYVLTADFGLQTTQRLAAGVMTLTNSDLVRYASAQISASNLVSGAFTEQSVTYTATGDEVAGSGAFGTPGDIMVAFSLPLSPGQSYLDFDNVKLTVVPEPGSIAIVALGGIGLLGRRKRMKDEG